MADTQVLGTCVFGRVGSSPTSRTKDRHRQGQVDPGALRPTQDLTYLFHDSHVISLAQRDPISGDSLRYLS